MWVVLVILVLLILAGNTPSREGFTPQPPQPLYTRSNALNCLSQATDRNIPVQVGSLQLMPTDRDTVDHAMRIAISTINQRCQMDFVVVAIDNPKKLMDPAKTVQCVAQVHVYSRHLNVSHCITLCTLQPTGLAKIYLQAATPLSSCAADTSGVKAAPADVFDQKYSEYKAL